MEIIFYNNTAIVIGLLLAYYGSYSLIKRKKKLFGIATIVISSFDIGFGIWGFFLNEYQFIVILRILAFTLIEIIFFLLFNKKEDKTKNNKTKVKKEENEEDYLEREEE
jgi:hypothetical membrane protein